MRIPTNKHATALRAAPLLRAAASCLNCLFCLCGVVVRGVATPCDVLVCLCVCCVCVLCMCVVCAPVERTGAHAHAGGGRRKRRIAQLFDQRTRNGHGRRRVVVAIVLGIAEQFNQQRRVIYMEHRRHCLSFCSSFLLAPAHEWFRLLHRHNRKLEQTMSAESTVVSLPMGGAMNALSASPDWRVSSIERLPTRAFCASAATHSARRSRTRSTWRWRAETCSRLCVCTKQSRAIRGGSRWSRTFARVSLRMRNAALRCRLRWRRVVVPTGGVL